MSCLLRMCQSVPGIVARQCSGVTRNFSTNLMSRLLPSSNLAAAQTQGTSLLSRCMASLTQMHKRGPIKKKKKKPGVLEGSPFKRAVVLKVVIKKPKKPNSANRKCVNLRLSNGREATAYIPKEGHNLQEHSIVLVRGGRLRDVPGVRLYCVRGKYDLAHVKK